MSEFNVRADSVNVEQIMDQIRARIREKRGVDYTEEQIRELASVKLEKFLDPRGVRSDLLEQFRKSRTPPPPVTLYPFEDTTLFDSHRGIVRLLRRLFRPVMKLFFNSNALAQSLHQQTIINRQLLDRLNAIDQRGDLYYELLHNLVLELTRATIEVKNVTMRVESISSRLEFNERRARALESVVVYKPSEPEREARASAPSSAPASPPQRSGGSFSGRENQRYAPQPPMPRVQAAPSAAAAPSAGSTPGATTPVPTTVPPAAATSSPGEASGTIEGPGQRSRRRRRRRGRRGGAPASAVMGASSDASPSGSDDAPAAPSPAQSAAEAGGAAHNAETPDIGIEPLQHALGSSAHPAEFRDDAPLPSPAAPPSPSSTASPTSSSSTEPPPSSDAHDDDHQ